MDVVDLLKKHKNAVYRTRNGVLLHGDCLKIMPRIPDGSADLVLADPPYNAGQEFANDRMTAAKYKDFMRRWIQQAYRVLAPADSSFYMFHFNQGMWDVKPILDAHPWRFLNLIIWHYPNMMPSNKRNMQRWPLSYQVIFYYAKKFRRDMIGDAYKAGDHERKDVWIKTAAQSNFQNNKRWHASSKPASIIKKILLANTREGDLVVDPFAGASTVAVVCEQLHRRWIAIEKMDKWCKVSIKRLRTEGYSAKHRFF
jgi:DNA modification methylase